MCNHYSPSYPLLRSVGPIQYVQQADTTARRYVLYFGFAPGATRENRDGGEIKNEIRKSQKGPDRGGSDILILSARLVDAVGV